MWPVSSHRVDVHLLYGKFRADDSREGRLYPFPSQTDFRIRCVEGLAIGKYQVDVSIDMCGPASAPTQSQVNMLSYQEVSMQLGTWRTKAGATQRPDSRWILLSTEVIQDRAKIHWSLDHLVVSAKSPQGSSQFCRASWRAAT